VHELKPVFIGPYVSDTRESMDLLLTCCIVSGPHLFRCAEMRRLFSCFQSLRMRALDRVPETGSILGRRNPQDLGNLLPIKIRFAPARHDFILIAR
jgi:hypothetical protein